MKKLILCAFVAASTLVAHLVLQLPETVSQRALALAELPAAAL